MIKPKYKEEDRVWGASAYKKDKQVPCPDCLGKRSWEVRLPNGEEFTIPCSTCKRGFEGSWGTITEWIQSAKVEQYTIGSVRVNTNDERPISYMCKETGIGSGTIHYEEDLHKDKVSALEHATQKAIEMCKEENKRKLKCKQYEKKKSKRNPTRKAWGVEKSE